MKRFATPLGVFACLFATFIPPARAGEPAPVVAESSPRLDRLERLAIHIATLESAPDRLSMGSWGHMRGDKAHARLVDVDDPEYQGCALGHAVAIFRVDGLRFAPGDGGTHSVKPEYAGQTGVDAGAAFFGISRGDAGQLFSNDRRTPTVEVGLIRAVIDRERQRLAMAESIYRPLGSPPGAGFRPSLLLGGQGRSRCFVEDGF
jgi:hypothetical protein